MSSSSDPNSTTRPANRLAREKSPYLLQHARNPVDWFPWGEEAFAEARRTARPIFLSIGYSTCHWCHVMERESFEDDGVAALLNELFVPVKVDREERPDVDRLYMTAAQAMGVGGGWPLNLFLTPELEPFFGGTYFPPESRLGHPGMKTILASVAQAWEERRAEIQRAGQNVIAALAGLGVSEGATAEADALYEQAYEFLSHSFDAEHGGFGSAPKFPSPSNLNFLLRFWARDPERNARAREMAFAQLDAMSAGGIHDHLGGGFHRYATDRGWLVPHFEKMLYDQAQLAWAYVEGFQIGGRPAYAEVARGIFAYVARDLTSPEGAFWSAEDADSEGEEGRFYVWTPENVAAALDGGEATAFCLAYGVTSKGNFEHGATILSRMCSTADVAKKLEIPEPEVEQRLASARRKLLEVRSQRVRPHRDDKVLTAWNGLMISACARGGRALGEATHVRAAERAAEFVWAKLRRPEGGLLRRWRDDEAGGDGQLDDYAYLALGLLDLSAATRDAGWLERATTLVEEMIERFWDEADGAFFESPAGDPSIKVRMKDGFDGAEMAGNSIAAFVLQTLGEALDRPEWLEKADRTFAYYSRRLAGGAMAMPQMLVAMMARSGAARQIVVAGDPDADETRALLAEIDRRFLPNDTLLVASKGRGAEALARIAPYAAMLAPRNHRATAYVCAARTCRLPATDAAELAAQLDERPAAAVAREE